MLEDGRAQLAAAQWDVPQRTKKLEQWGVIQQRLSTSEYRRIRRYRVWRTCKADGLRLAQSGGQFRSSSAWPTHFGLRLADFQFLARSDEAAGNAFLNGGADAVLRVRALGDQAIQQLVQSGKVRFLISIAHAAAMRIKYPAFEAAVIPEGASGKSSQFPPGLPNGGSEAHAAGSPQ